MKITRFVLPLLTIFLLMSACGQPQQEATEKPAEAPEIKMIFENISIAQFKSMSPDENVIILDVRTDGEVAQGAIENSIQIDFYSEDFKDRIAALDPDKTYIVYCRSGGRSAQASRMMTEELGFKDVKNLEGGYNAFSSSEN